MNGIHDSIQISDWLESGAGGILRGAGALVFVHPLSVLKTHQQCASTFMTVHQISGQLWKKGGIRPFYRGVVPQFCNTLGKQLWCWPLIIQAPKVLKREGFQGLRQQAVLGLCIGTVDSIGGVCFDKRKTLLIVQPDKILSRWNILKGGLSQWPSYWRQRTVSWTTFLVTQQYFRDQYRKYLGEEKLNFIQLTEVGVSVAVVVTIIAAPFDLANQLRQSERWDCSKSFFGNLSGKAFLGARVNFVSLVVHNIASVVLLEFFHSKNKG